MKSYNYKQKFQAIKKKEPLDQEHKYTVRGLLMYFFFPIRMVNNYWKFTTTHQGVFNIKLRRINIFYYYY